MSRTTRALLGIATNYAAAFVTAIAGFVLVPIILRFVGREDYGLWATVGQAVAYLALLDFGVGSALIRRTAQDLHRDDGDRRASAALSTAFVVYCALGGIFLAAGFALAQALPRILSLRGAEGAVATKLFMLMVAYGAFALPMRVWAKTLFGRQEIARGNLVTLIENLVTPVACALLLVAGVGIVSLPLGSIAAGTLASVAAFVMLRRAAPHVRLSWRKVSAVDARDLFTWSWMLGLNSLAVVVIYQTDNLVVAAGRGLSAAAVYALTSRLPLYAMPLVFAIADSCLPAVIDLCERRRMDRVREAYLQVARLAVGAAFGAALVAVAFNGPFVRLWVGSENYGGSLLTAAFVAILVYRVLMQTSSLVVIGTGRIHGVVWMSIVEAALNLALSIWWVRLYGIAGVAAATIVAGLATSAWYVTRTVASALGIRVTAYLSSTFGRPLVCVAVAAMVAATIRATVSIAGWIDLALAVGVTGATYAAMFYAAGLTRSERGELHRRIRGAAPGISRLVGLAA